MDCDEFVMRVYIRTGNPQGSLSGCKRAAEGDNRPPAWELLLPDSAPYLLK